MTAQTKVAFDLATKSEPQLQGILREGMARFNGDFF